MIIIILLNFVCVIIYRHIGLRFNVSGDTENLERRIIFENGNSEFSREITAHIDTQSCAIIVAYVRVCAYSGSVLNQCIDVYSMHRCRNKLGC